MSTDNAPFINAIGFNLKNALKAEQDLLKELVRLKQLITGYTTAIETLGADPTKAADEAKAPRVTPAQAKKVDEEATKSAPASQADEPAESAKPGTTEAAAAPTEIDPDEPGRKPIMDETRSIATQLAKDHGLGDKIKEKIAAYGVGELKFLDTARLTELRDAMKKQLEKLSAPATDDGW